MLVRRITAIHDVIVLYIYFGAYTFVFVLISRIAAVHSGHAHAANTETQCREYCQQIFT